MGCGSSLEVPPRDKVQGSNQETNPSENVHENSDEVDHFLIDVNRVGISTPPRESPQGVTAEGSTPEKESTHIAIPSQTQDPCLESQFRHMCADYEQSLFKDVSESTLRLPAEGTPPTEMMALMKKRSELDSKYWADGKVSGSVYHGGREHMEMVGNVYSMFAYANPLHPGLFPSTRQMDAEV
eukprot:Hpha_TRINITY_DN16620_c0_g2::TRINITY_DN16620_c0_g2_i1::g.179092::m.179092